MNSFVFAWHGLVTVWKEELNFRIEVFISFFVIFYLVWFKFSFSESVACIIGITLVLISEIINTAVEDLCNKVEPNHDVFIGKIKDTMGAFVLISVLGALAIGVLVFYNHFL